VNKLSLTLAPFFRIFRSVHMGAESLKFAVPDATWNVADRAMPTRGKLVKYRTASYQMLGYVDTLGRWVATDGMEEPLPVKSWRDIVDPLPTWPERLV
jgi:hypothetical protein